jgi:hypothetical protein
VCVYVCVCVCVWCWVHVTQVLDAFRSFFVTALRMFDDAAAVQAAGTSKILSPGMVWAVLDGLRNLPKTDKIAFRRSLLLCYTVAKDTADEFKTAIEEQEAGLDDSSDAEGDDGDGSGGDGVGGGGARGDVVSSPGGDGGGEATTPAVSALPTAPPTLPAASPVLPTSAASAAAAGLVFKHGEEVDCLFQGDRGGDEWHPGRIESINVDNTRCGVVPSHRFLFLPNLPPTLTSASP